MAPRSNDAPLVVLVGETASGKTALALHLAKVFGGEIIAADSRTVYSGLDIGTAKPNSQERLAVPHHLLDVVTPDQEFTVADFKNQALRAIREVGDRGRLPLLVGGTGLYVDAVVYDFTFRPPAEAEERERLERLSVEQLQAIILEQSLVMPLNARNPRHLIRAIEAKGVTPKRTKLRENTLFLGLKVEPEVLRSKLEARVAAMVSAGFIEEVKRVAGQYGWGARALQAPGYRAFRAYIEGSISLEEASAKFIQNDWQLARRQRTWFKRDDNIHWICKTEEAVDLVTTFLNK
jgi:tRNA dimethylallyltransferase